MDKNFKYDAFISYRHVEPDATIAAALHRGIETYKLPKNLETDVELTHRVFRDREELSTRDLSDSIMEALEQSRFLIVISSPRTPLSPWCIKEVETFRRLHGDERIFSLLIEGEPDVSFSQPLKDLKKTVIRDGRTFVESAEILAADIRPKDVKDPQFPGYDLLKTEDPKRYETLKKESLKLLKDSELTRIMAGMLGVTYGDLKQRDRERRLRAMLYTASGISIALLIFGIAIFRMYVTATVAERKAKEQTTLMTLNYASDALKKGDRTRSLVIGERAMEDADPKMENFSEIKTRYTALLNESLIREPYTSLSILSSGRYTPYFSISADQKVIYTGGEGSTVNLFDIEGGKALESITAHDYVTALTVDEETGEVYAATTGKNIEVFTPGGEDSEFRILFPTGESDNYSDIAVFPGNTLVARTDRQNIDLWDLHEKKKRRTLTFTEDDPLANILVDRERNVLLIATQKGNISAWNLSTGEAVFQRSFPSEGLTITMALSPQRNYDFMVQNTLYTLSPQGETIKTLHFPQGSGAFVTDNAGRVYVVDTFHRNYNVNVYDNSTGELLGFLTGGGERVARLMLNQTTGDVIVAGTSGGVSVFRDVIPGENVPFRKDIVPKNADLLSSGLTKDDRFLIFGYSDGTLAIIDTVGNKQGKEFAERPMTVTRDHRKVLLQSADYSSLVIRNFTDSEPLALLQLEDDSMGLAYLYALSDSGATIARASLFPGELLIFSKENETHPVLSISMDKEMEDPLAGLIDVVFSHDDSRLLLFYENGETFEVDRMTGEIVAHEVFPEGMRKVNLSPDDRYVALLGDNDKTLIYERTTKKKLNEIDGEVYGIVEENGKPVYIGVFGEEIFKHTDGKTTFVASNKQRIGNVSGERNFNDLSLDGKTLITGTYEGLYVLTDVSTGIAVKSFPVKNGQRENAFFNEDGTKLFVTSRKDFSKIEDFPEPDVLENQARELLNGREISDKELESIGR